MPMNSAEFPLVWMSFAHEPGHDVHGALQRRIVPGAHAHLDQAVDEILGHRLRQVRCLEEDERDEDLEPQRASERPRQEAYRPEPSLANDTPPIAAPLAHVAICSPKRRARSGSSSAARRFRFNVVFCPANRPETAPVPWAASSAAPTRSAVLTLS